MAKLAFDLDGVTYNFVDALRLWINKSTGKPLEEMPPANDWNFFKSQWGFTSSEYMEFLVSGIKDDDLMWVGDAYPQAREVTYYLHEVRGDEITFITARQYDGLDPLTSQIATQYWLASEDIVYDNLIIANDKIGYDFDVLFDDAPHNVEAGIIAGDNVVMFDQPWNTHMDWVERVYDWKGILNYVETKFPKKMEKHLTS